MDTLESEDSVLDILRSLELMGYRVTITNHEDKWQVTCTQIHTLRIYSSVGCTVSEAVRAAAYSALIDRAQSGPTSKNLLP